MSLLQRSLLLLTASVPLVLSAMGGGPAFAGDSTPAAAFFKAPVPIVGAALSDSSATPLFAIKDGWTVFDPDGVSSASASFTTYNLYPNPIVETVWSFSGGTDTTTATGRIQRQIRVRSAVYGLS